MRRRIAYYAHHHGSGHIQHAKDFADTVSYELLILSSKDFNSTPYDHVTYLQLPDDAVYDYSQPENSPFHYTPNHPAIRKRFQMFAAALEEFNPDLVIVDVSVEIAAFTTLLGYKVAYRLLHGDRNDMAHSMAFHSADRLIAYYPREIEQKDRAAWLLSKIEHIGIREILSATDVDKKPYTICVLTSTGGSGLKFKDLAYACAQTPEWSWTVLGKLDGFKQSIDTLPVNCEFKGYVSNPDVYLSQAEIIISSSGHNAVARSVSHGAPLILFAENRPFKEQHYFATEIARVTDAAYVHSWQAAEWHTVLNEARRQSPYRTRSCLLLNDKKYGERLQEIVDGIIAEPS